jgi:hypothetical protein
MSALDGLRHPRRSASRQQPTRFEQWSSAGAAAGAAYNNLMVQYIEQKLLRIFQGAQTYINVAIFHKDWALAKELMNEIKTAHGHAMHQVLASEWRRKVTLSSHCCVTLAL